MSVVFIKILPSSVLRTSRLLKNSASDLHNVAEGLRKVHFAGFPPEWQGELCRVQSAATIAGRHAETLGAKGGVLEKKIEKLVASEATPWVSATGKTLKGLKFGDDFSIWLSQNPRYPTKISGAVRLDAYVEFLEWRHVNGGGGAAYHAWRSIVAEVSVLDSTSVRSFRVGYAEAVAAALRRGNGGRVSAALIDQTMRQLAMKAEVDVPKPPKLPGWAKTRFIPVLGALVDGYVGYKMSKSDKWWVKAYSGGSNAATNAAFDFVPGYGVADFGTEFVGKDYQPSKLTQVIVDAEALALFNDEQGLVYLHRAVETGHHGKLAQKAFARMSEAEFIAWAKAQSRLRWSLL